MLCIDIIEGCNNKCFFCKAKNIKNYNFMDKELFYSIIKQCSVLQIYEIDLIPNSGEPFLHPNIYDFLKFLDKNKMKVILFTNLVLVDIKLLETLNLRYMNLNISHYGNTEEEYIYHTGTNSGQYKRYLKQLELLKNSSLLFNIESRTESTYHFDYNGGPQKRTGIYKNCEFHYGPKIDYDGKITYCKFVNSNIEEPIYFDTINLDSDLYKVLSSPKRFEFFNSNEICGKQCNNYNDSCAYQPKLIDYKFLQNSKKNWSKIE